MHSFYYDGRHFVVYLSEAGKMAVRLPVLRKRNLDDVLHLPYDSLKLSFRPTPPPSSDQTRYRLSLSTGISQHGAGSPKKGSEPPAAAGTSSAPLPDANPANQSFLVHDAGGSASSERPGSQEARQRGSGPRLGGQGGPRAAPVAPTDLSGINVLQLELRQQQQQPASSSWRASRPPAASSSSCKGPARPRALASEALNVNGCGPAPKEDGEETNGLLCPPRLAPRLQANGVAPGSAETGGPPSLVGSGVSQASAASRRSPGRSCQLPLPVPSRAADGRFCYPDPLTGATNSFHQRISEIALLEADTVRWERLRTYRRKPRLG